jgi:hypothetical protein
VLGAWAAAQNTKQTPGRIVTTTRLVAVFSELEESTFKAAQQNDLATLHRVLSDEFEVWTPEPPGQPIPGEDWLKKMAADKVQSFRFRQMAVRSLGDDISVVSFVLTEVSTTPKSYFIVDVWTRSDGSWRLRDRYQSRALAETRAPAVDKPPSGRN